MDEGTGSISNEPHSLFPPRVEPRELLPEEANFNPETERRTIDETLERVRSVGPAVMRLKDIPDRE
jgi:hypothetical protein